MTERKIIGIQSVETTTGASTNIMDVDIWAVTDDGNEDLVEVLFTPHTFEGVAFRQWAKCWLVKIVHDGWTDIYDAYIDDDGESAAIPLFKITFDIKKTAANKTTEIWTFQTSKSYVMNRDELRVEIEQKRTPGAIYIVCIGTVTITHV